MSRNCVWLRVHLVWTTKFREPMIDSAWETDLYAYIAGIAKNKGCHLIASGGMPDHVHLYVGLSNDISVGRLVNAIKSNSSRWINEVHPSGQTFRWQRGYGAFTMNQRNEGTYAPTSPIRNVTTRHELLNPRCSSSPNATAIPTTATGSTSFSRWVEHWQRATREGGPRARCRHQTSPKTNRPTLTDGPECCTVQRSIWSPTAF
jgi:putative transposase